MHPQQLAAMHQRLCNIERNNISLRRSQYLLLACLVAAVSVAALHPSAETITAQEFVLVDAAGQVCAVWTTSPAEGHQYGRASLTFRSDRGTVITMDAGNGNPSLQLSGTDDSDVHEGEAHAALRVHRTEGAQLVLEAFHRTLGELPRKVTGYETLVGLAYPDAPPSLRVKAGADVLWTAPEGQ